MEAPSGYLVSDFNLGNLSRYLANDGEVPEVGCTSAPYGQVMSALLSPSWSDRRPDFAVVWASPEHVSPAYADCVAGRDCSVAAARAEVEAFGDAVRSFSTSVGVAFVATFVATRETPSSSLLRMRAGIGSTRMLMEMNLRLADSLCDASNVYLLDASRWAETANGCPRDPRLWYLAKVPFANEVFAAAAREIKGCLRGVAGSTRKLVLLDLDDTLWGGLVGDVGWEKLRLGGHDPIGEGYVDFQRALKSLTRRGILLGIVSKNDADMALEAIDRHPEMVLRRQDFAGWRITRDDKARSIVQLALDLNLGLESVVFIDDSPAERARVRETLPEVLVPEWPSQSMLFSRALAELRCFDAPAVTAEDTMRTGMYETERSRTELLQRVGSVEEWLKTLDLRVAVEPIEGPHFERVVQLLNKTNQLNLATRRLTGAQLHDWLKAPGRYGWCFRLTDRFGDSGITGVLSIERTGDIGDIRDFVISCRVMGRKLEETMLHVAITFARAAGLREVRARYEPTPRNMPCLEFLQRAGFPDREGEHVFIWHTRRDYPLPEAVTCSLTWNEAAAACPARS